MNTPKSNPIARAVRVALLAGTTAAAMSIPTAFAAEDADQEADQGKKIVVTGSRIKRVDVEGATPVLVLDREAIEATGLASLGDIVQDLPAAGSAINTTFNNGGDGSTEIDLRNLGSNRVLVMVNGRRWNPGLFGSVDLNNIPAAVIERVEVLKDGASAIYGSDAIAGVVNIYTRKDYNGAYLNAYYGQSEEGDGTVENYDFGIGASTDKGSAFLAMSFYDQGPIWAGDREISAVPVFGTAEGFQGSSGTPQGRFLYYTPGFLGFVNDTLDANGNFTPWQEPGSRFNYAPLNYLLTPSKRKSIYAQASYNFSDDLQFSTELFYNNRISAQVLAPTPLFLGYFSSGLGTQTYIAADNPYNPLGYALDSTCSDPAAGCLLLLGRRMLEAGTRNFNQDVDSLQWNAGFTGTIETGDMFWDWDVNYVHAIIQNNEITEGLLNMQRVNQALLGPGECNANNGCVPLNLFGGQGPNGDGTITQEMLNYITFVAQDASETRMDSFSANITGELMELPGGALGVAAGFETREHSGFDQPDALIAAGITSGNSRQPTKGEYSLDEYYVEFLAPVLADQPGARLLEFSAAVRGSDYSNFGSTTNTKFGVRYQPIEEVMLRASVAEGFRAPSITELFRGNSDSFPQLSDPCSGQAALDTNNDGTIDAAEASAAGLPGCAGVSASYVQPNSQIRITVGGNPNLEPEESTSTTFGVVWQPEYIEGFDMTLDWWNIEVTNNIGSLGAQSILDGCANNLFNCGLITRTATGNVADLFNGNVNTGEVEVEGVDVTMNYRLPETEFGTFRLVWDTTHSRDYITRDVDLVTGELQESDFVGFAGDRVVLPEIRSNFNVYWSYGDWSAVWRMRYISATTENCSFGNGDTNNTNELMVCNELDPNTANATTTAEFNALEHKNKLYMSVWHDMSVSYNLSDMNAEITVGGVNVFAKDPAPSYSTFANSFDPTMYDVPGAFWYVRYSQEF